MKNCNLKFKRHKGFVLLFALLISSILLATGLGISRLMVRQISLASLSRESQVAFFAADSGMECAAHWDNAGKFDFGLLTAPLQSRSIYCNGYIIQDGAISRVSATNSVCDAYGEPPEHNKINNTYYSDGVTKKNCFTFSMTNQPGETANSLKKNACAFVVIDKSNDTKTIITSNGYNRCDLSLPDALQRTLEVTKINR